MSNSNIIEDFKSTDNEFTVFVIGQAYYYGRGHDYLSQFLTKDNWIASDRIIEKRIKKVLSWIQKNTPNIADLVMHVIDATKSKLNLVDIIVSLSKLFSVSEHVAAGPEVIDPIIIEEENVSKKNLTQYVTMHESCKYRPAIIILLKDNDYERAKSLLVDCPNGMNVKMIYSNGTATHYKVINCGAKTVDDFVDFFARQCFSTCSKTDHNVLLASEWSDNLVISKFAPTIFQIRSTFIKEHKLDAAPQIKWLNQQLAQFGTNNHTDKVLKNSFLCMSKLFDAYCYDRGGTQITDALTLATELDNEILKAHVYRYSHFFSTTRQRKQELLQEAEAIFSKYSIADHAVYCRNNRLIHQFSQDKISINDFCELEGIATHDTPGLALMAHIINNVGIAYLLEHHFESAIETFSRGLEFAGNDHIQILALKSNRLIAKALNFHDFDEVEARGILRIIFGANSLGIIKMPFLTAQFALNVIACAFMSNPKIAAQLLHEHDVAGLVKSSFATNIMGTGPLIKQMEILSKKYNEFTLMDQLQLPKERTTLSGIRLNFIALYGLNPFFFNTWL